LLRVVDVQPIELFQWTVFLELETGEEGEEPPPQRKDLGCGVLVNAF
jgi:hypothetical protein